MNPLEVLAAVGLKLSDFNLTNVAVFALQTLGKVTSNWTFYQHIAQELGLGAGAAGAIKASKIAQVLGRQDLWIPALDPRATIPRAMSQISEREPELGKVLGGVRYDVYIEVVFNENGKLTKQPYYIGVDSDTLLPEQVAIDRALVMLEDRFNNYVPRTRERLSDWYVDSVRVGGFYRYVTRGA